MLKRRKLALIAGAALAMPYIRPARAALRIRLAIAHAATDHFGVAAATFAETLRTASGGRILVDVFTDGALGSEENTLAGVRAGTLDVTILASGLLGNYTPEIGLLDMPFLFRDAAHARTVLDGPAGREYADMSAANGLPVIGWAENGVRHLTANRAIRTAAELKGLKLRIMPAPLLLAAFRAMGADAGILSWQLVYEALRVGEFDAQENPIPTIVAAHLNEVQSHVMLTAHTYSAACIVASPNLLEDIPPADRDLLGHAAQAAVSISRTVVDRTTVTGIVWLREQGTTVITDIDRESFKVAALPAEIAVARNFGADRIARLRDAG